jgi:hypothetical protein
MQQNALYYPHIGLHNAAWIKAMALFYDNIYRIVPDNVIPEDAEELNPRLQATRMKPRAPDPERWAPSGKHLHPES